MRLHDICTFTAFNPYSHIALYQILLNYSLLSGRSIPCVSVAVMCFICTTLVRRLIFVVSVTVCNSAYGTTRHHLHPTLSQPIHSISVHLPSIILKPRHANNTQGGTESIILAIKAHRDYYLQQHGISRPEIICCVSAHAAVDKVNRSHTPHLRC